MSEEGLGLVGETVDTKEGLGRDGMVSTEEAVSLELKHFAAWRR